MILRSVVKEDQIQHQWSMLTVDIADEEDREEVLSYAVEMWITFRGLAVVSNWLGHYKLATPKNTI